MTAGDAGGQQRGPPLDHGAHGARVEQRARPWASVAWASHSSRVGRRLPGGVEQRADRLAGQGGGGLVGGGEHHGDAGAGGDPGRLDLGLHAAGAEPGRAGCADPDAGEVGVAAHVGRPGELAGSAGSAS